MLVVLVAVLGCQASRAPHSTMVLSGDDARAPRPDPLSVPAVALPDPTVDRPTSLDEILAYADRHAPAVRVARVEVLRGEEAMASAKPLFPDNPELAVGVGPRFRTGDTAVDFEVSLAQRFEVAGERGLRIDAARRLRDRLQAELDQTRWETHRDVHAAFHDALVARERARVTERLLAFQERLSDIAHRRFVAGDVSSLVVRIAEGETAQARVAAIAAQQAYDAARLRLAELAGWPAAHPPEPAGTLDPPRQAPPLEHIVKLAKANQPTLRALSAAVAEAEANIDVADREAWPEPALGVQLLREGGETGVSGAETIVLGTLSVPIPFWQRNQGDRAAARAERAIAAVRADAFENQLVARIARAKIVVDAAARRVAAYGTEILPTFEESLRLIQRAYELGEIDILEVSVARERFLRMQENALDAYADYFRAVAQLESAVGTELWPDKEHAHSETTGGAP